MCTCFHPVKTCRNEDVKGSLPNMHGIKILSNNLRVYIRNRLYKFIAKYTFKMNSTYLCNWSNILLCDEINYCKQLYLSSVELINVSS